MSLTRVLVLGAGGMLGGMVARVLSAESGFQVVTTDRRGRDSALAFDAGRDSVEDLVEATDCGWIVNAIGVLDRRIDEADPQSVAAAFSVNANFPNGLVHAAGPDRRVLHFTTDGVFSGQHAPYDELASRDAGGVYALSKSLGEVDSPTVMNLRCSIIGPEKAPARSLMGWALSRPPGATVDGFVNHRWNGLTTLHVAKLCAALIGNQDDEYPSNLHLIPGDSVSKAELLTLILAAFGRGDVTVRCETGPQSVDRTLSTIHPAVNGRLWLAAGYDRAPTVGDMVAELASFMR